MASSVSFFSVTVLAGFQLQHVDAHADQPTQQTQNAVTNAATKNSVVSGVVTGSFGYQPSTDAHAVTLQSANSTATSTTTQTDSNQPTPSSEVPTTPQTPSPETPIAPNTGTVTSNPGSASTTQGSSTREVQLRGILLISSLHSLLNQRELLAHQSQLKVLPRVTLTSVRWGN